LKALWRANFLALEGAAALAATVVLIILSECVIGPERLDSYLEAERFTVFPQLAALSGALLGLVITAGALVLDRMADGRLSLIQRSRHGDDLWQIFRAAMRALGFSTVLGIIALVPTGCTTIDRWIAYAWLLAGFLSVVRIARVIWVVGFLLAIISRQGNEGGA
jgi:hypothetical protein